MRNLTCWAGQPVVGDKEGVEVGREVEAVAQVLQPIVPEVQRCKLTPFPKNEWLKVTVCKSYKV